MSALLELLKKHNLPESLIIENIRNKSQLEIDFGTSDDKKSNIFTGKTKSGDEVIIKEVKIKEKDREIRMEELKILWTLTRMRKIDKSTCKSCNEEICQNFTKLIGCYEEDGKICIVLENAGHNFLKFISEPRDEKDVEKIFFELAKAVKCLHANFIAHLDISASNVLILEENGKFSVRLADFGESEIFPETNISINPLKSRKDLKITQLYGAPEWQFLQIADSPKYYDPYKVDIFSLGIFFVKFCLRIEVDEENKQEIRDLLEKARNDKDTDITFIEEELALFMTENEPTNRADIIGVCTNPVSWDYKKYYSFIERVNCYKMTQSPVPEIIRTIEDDFSKKFFMEGKEWLDFTTNETVRKEINRYKIRSKVKINTRSIFSLLYVIITIYESKNNEGLAQNLNDFNETRNETKADIFETYMQFWIKKFKTLIDLLYFYMKNDLKMLYPDLYGISTPDRCFRKRKVLSDNEKTFEHEKISSKVTRYDSINEQVSTGKKVSINKKQPL